MLGVEERYMIRELNRRGISISEIARLTGCDRKTVRRALKSLLIPESKVRRTRTCKIDPYVKYLEARIEEGVLNASKLYTEIKAQGYQGCSSQVRVFVHPSDPPPVWWTGG